MFKFLFFCFMGFMVYQLFVKPFLVRNLAQRNAQHSGNNMMDVLRQFQQFQEQQRQQQQGYSSSKKKSKDEGEYTDYEEIK